MTHFPMDSFRIYFNYQRTQDISNLLSLNTLCLTVHTLSMKHIKANFGMSSFYLCSEVGSATNPSFYLHIKLDKLHC